MRRPAALLALLLTAPAAALSPIAPRPAPAFLIGPAAGGVASAALGGLPPGAVAPPGAAPGLKDGLGPALILPGTRALGPAGSGPARREHALPRLRRVAEALADAPDGSSPLGALWDGAVGRGAGLGSAPQLPACLRVAKAKDREFIAEAVQAARESPIARDILDRVEALVDKRGRPVRVVVGDLKNDWGHYDYVKDVLAINSRLRDDPAVAAPTLAHELLHILQHAEGVPAEALELELEAHIVTLRVMEELGIESDGGGFSVEAARRLAIGPEEFIAWMKTQLPGKLLLIGSDFESLKSDLEDEVGELELKDGKRSRGRLDWALHDLELVRSPAGRKRYRAFADRVHALIRDEHRRRASR